MIIVDSSIWIDYFNGKITPQTDWLDSSLGNTPIIVGDIILAEVLQGFQNDKDFQVAKDLLWGMPFMAMGGRVLALQSAMNYRSQEERRYCKENHRHNDRNLLYSLPVTFAA
jgi:predicted nucleic acid-binding protein